jgi:hypothetical protein
VYEDNKMQNGIWIQMIQGYAKVIQKTMKKRTSRKAQAVVDKGDEEDNLTRLEGRNPMFSRFFPLPEFWPGSKP